MSDNALLLLSDLRNILEHQMDLYGPHWTTEQNAGPDARDKVATQTDKVIRQQAKVERQPEKATTEDDNLNMKVTQAKDSSAPGADAGNEVLTDDAYARIESLIPADSPLQSMTSLEQAQDWVAHTELIPLDKSRLNPVFGVGHPDADLMVIGEAPGADEDKQGEPFVGRAGQLLTGILSSIGFEREDVYIANILKSRPPNNRKPERDEVAAHLPVLYKQIVLVRPKVILCVGKTAGMSLLGLSTSLSAMRSTFHDYHGLPVLVTYHPAALLRNPHWKRPTWEDVQLLRKKYDALSGRPPSGTIYGNHKPTDQA